MTRIPSKQEERQALAEAIGTDGARLLGAIHSADAPGWLRGMSAVETLRRVWMRNYYQAEDGIRWRTREEGIPPSLLFLSSPYDPDGHYARERTTS